MMTAACQQRADIRRPCLKRRRGRFSRRDALGCPTVHCSQPCRPFNELAAAFGSHQIDTLSLLPCSGYHTSGTRAPSMRSCQGILHGAFPVCLPLLQRAVRGRESARRPGHCMSQLRCQRGIAGRLASAGRLSSASRRATSTGCRTAPAVARSGGDRRKRRGQRPARVPRVTPTAVGRLARRSSRSLPGPVRRLSRGKKSVGAWFAAWCCWPRG